MTENRITRYRVKISIAKPASWLSHLDLLSTLGRALRRAALPLRFSEGFNPHLLISWGPAHPVGLICRGEYFDLDFASPPPEGWEDKVNAVLAAGLRLEAVKEIGLFEKSLMAAIDIAEYELFFAAEEAEIIRAAEAFLAQSSHMVERVSPKGTKTVDIRQGVISLLPISGGLRLLVRLAIPGSPRPAEVAAALALPLISLHRSALYISEGEEPGAFNKVF